MLICYPLFELQSGEAISKLSEVLGESLASYQHVLLQSLMKEIPGRLWEVGYYLLSVIKRTQS